MEFYSSIRKQLSNHTIALIQNVYRLSIHLSELLYNNFIKMFSSQRLVDVLLRRCTLSKIIFKKPHTHMQRRTRVQRHFSISHAHTQTYTNTNALTRARTQTHTLFYFNVLHASPLNFSKHTDTCLASLLSKYIIKGWETREV